MLTPEERFTIWEDFHDRAHKLFIDVEDAIYSEFAPYKHDKNGELVKPDKDTPEAKKLFDMLADLDAFLQKREESAGIEYSAWLDEQRNLQNAYEAWSLGLCPQVMRTVPKYLWFMPSSWYKIAQLKQFKGISREDTMQAIASWEAQRTLAS
jgi:hypothetical protein